MPFVLCPAHLWTPIELQTEILPHLALTNMPVRNPGTTLYLMPKMLKDVGMEVPKITRKVQHPGDDDMQQ